MKLIMDGVELPVELGEVREVSFDDEIIAYCPASGKILTMDADFAAVWREIKNRADSFTLSDVSLAKLFCDDENDIYADVMSSVRDCVKTLFAAGFIRGGIN
ncbi:MAG: hypothetical protein LBD85_02825 [Oscillospiraceae bacterium]|jgi:hypothetical protein|nr:hypothetical protein [Oscillospiraceae bacterium]